MTTLHPSRRTAGRRALRHATLRQRGQAMIALVLGITVIMATGAGILATNVIQHDPLVQNDVVQHYAYRALEAGTNTFLSAVNTNPNEMGCSKRSTDTGQCTPADFLTPRTVTHTTGPGVVPESYVWGNPVFCYTPSCTGVQPPTVKDPLLYVKETIYGEAGFPGHVAYQRSTLDLKSENGFLTHIWWSEYEATDPADTGGTTSDCTYDYKNNYQGPTKGTPRGTCTAVYFGPGDIVNGPIFSDDSIYVSGGPTLGPVQTADPNYLFCTGVGGSGTCKKHHTGIVTQTATAVAGDKYNAGFEPLPTSDSSFLTFAKLHGCVYDGPTTITFDKTGQMTVWSPDTPNTDTTPANRDAVNTATCPSTGRTAPVPNGTHGNGVIYVQAQPTPLKCKPTANPYSDYTPAAGANGPTAQWGYKGTYANYLGKQGKPNCEADAFVSDHPTLGHATAGAITGQLTVASAANVVVTGNLKYADCGPTFNSTVTHPCTLHPTGRPPNDVLGLVATAYVEVNHPVQPTCSTYFTFTTFSTITACTKATPTNATLLPNCPSTVLGTPKAALCNPGSTLTIDAAILALKHSFAVNNYGDGAPEKHLIVYGSIDQKWRGAVGTFSFGTLVSGYSKEYDWDSRIAAITPPFYLNPGTPSWALTSSAVTPTSTPPP